ncbi:MAG: methyltransferase domain-containing protein [Actinomycetota bacterium]|nr:methyltransferase domain-containing protein [Actinomycetota bacterium]
MKRKLVPLLACPACGKGILDLARVDREEAEIEEAVLVCGRCSRGFQIRGGIVDLLHDPTAEVLREIEAWESFLACGERDPEAGERSRERLLSLPFLEGQGAPRWEVDTWRRHGRAAFGMCEGEDLEGRSVLELGAGRCWLSAHLARLGAEVVAVDVLEAEGIGLGSAEVFLEEGIHFERVLCDMHHLPFGAGSFDAIVTTATLHHSHDPAALFREIKRVMKKGGVLIAANEPLYVPWREITEEEKRGAHEGAYSLARWLHMLGDAGWTLIELEVGREGAVHFKVSASKAGGGLPPSHRIKAWAGYGILVVLALPRKILSASRRLAAGRPMRSYPGDMADYFKARLGLSHAGDSAMAGEEGNWGPGWYRQEGEAEPFRWSGARACFLLAPPHEAARLALELATFHPSPQSHPTLVEVRVGWVKAGDIRLDRHGWRTFRLEIPHGYAVGRRLPAVVTIKVRRGYFRPSQMDLSEDNRLLGVACRGAWWEVPHR